MKLFVETCLDDLFLALIKNNKIIEFIHDRKMVRKSDRLPIAMEIVLQKAHLNIKDVESIYVTKGPGSFMGVRAGLIYTSTIAQILKTKFYVTDTLTFISGGEKGEYYIDAKSSQAYYLKYPGKAKLIKSLKKSKMNYELFKSNPEKFLTLFEKTNPAKVQAFYIKEPKVG